MTRTVSTILMIATISLAGCEGIDLEEEPSSLDIAPGTVLELHQDLEVAPHAVKVALQGGRINRSGPDLYYPHCFFEVRNPAAGTQIIAAGRYTITEVAGSEDRYSGGDTYTYVTEFRLLPAQSDSLWRVSCEVVSTSDIGKAVTMRELDTVFGQLAALIPPVPGGS